MPQCGVCLKRPLMYTVFVYAVILVVLFIYWRRTIEKNSVGVNWV